MEALRGPTLLRPSNILPHSSRLHQDLRQEGRPNRGRLNRAMSLILGIHHLGTLPLLGVLIVLSSRSMPLKALMLLNSLNLLLIVLSSRSMPLKALMLLN